MKNRKIIHRDGIDICLRITKRYSLGFGCYESKIFFKTLFYYNRSRPESNGSLWWKGLSFKEKIIDKDHGLGKFLCFNYGFEKRPYHGVNWKYLTISFLTIKLYIYYDKININCGNNGSLI